MNRGAGMGIKELMDTSKLEWISREGPDSDIIVSSRVRLARNIKDVPFPHLLDSSRAKEIVKQVSNAFNTSPVLASNSNIYFMNELSPVERTTLVELHLISPDLASSENGAVIIKQSETVSIMINEEDHIRIQTVFPGLQLEQAYDLASKVDDILEENLDFAFNEKIGYLTSCPTNVGTGLRASLMMHLPLLTKTKQINRIFSTISQLGLVVRGLFGEGTQVKGNLYQISNQITLGKSEQDIIENLIGVAQQVIKSERKLRENLTEDVRVKLEDKILRSYGILTNAKIITSEEAMELISNVRLGVYMGIIKDLKPSELNQLFVAIGPAYIQQMSNSELSPMERDLFRAEFIKSKLK